MNKYRRMDTLFSVTGAYLSVAKASITSYTRWDTSSNKDVVVSSYSGTPSSVYLSPSSFVIDGVEKLNSAWYLKDITSLSGSVTLNSKTKGLTTGNLNPKDSSNTIGAITPYKSIRVKQLIDLFPVGSIYMSLKNNDPAAIFGGQWDLLPSRFLYGGSSKGNYTTSNQGGASTVTLELDNMPSHTHSCSSAGSHTHNVRVRNDGNPDGWSDKSNSSDRQYWNTADNQYSQRYNLNPQTESAGSHTHTMGNSGSGTAFSILPPYQLVNIWYRSA